MLTLVGFVPLNSSRPAVTPRYPGGRRGGMCNQVEGSYTRCQTSSA